MIREIMAVSCGAGLILALSGCGEQTVRNCPVIGASPSSDIYHLQYELVIPADCPIPLGSPGIEKKYAAAYVWDLNGIDMEHAQVQVHNSSGKRVANQITAYISSGTNAVATLKAEYTAATGAQTFSDYDIATFRTWNSSNGNQASGKTRLTYQQTTMATGLAGEAVPLPNTTHTWTAPVSGGYPAFAYQWYRNGSPVGTGSSYSSAVDTADFHLRVEVTDDTWSTVAAVLAVDVGGVAAAISGPALLNESQRGTWTASARGGTGAYTFEWYVDDRWSGTGPTLSRTLGGGDHDIRVNVTDSAGAFDSHWLGVTVRASVLCPNGQRVC